MYANYSLPMAASLTTESCYDAKFVVTGAFDDKVGIMTTLGCTTDDEAGIMTTLGF